MTEAQAHIAYNILVLYAGANQTNREEFVYYMTSSGREYRFQGHLGFGGKLYKNGEEAWVDCYTEDLTPEREKIIATVNNLLKDLFDETAPA